MEIFSESTGDAWDKASKALLESGERTTVNERPMVEKRWLAIHVKSPLSEPRISERFKAFSREIGLEEGSQPQAYLQQVTGQRADGDWWNIYGKPIWEQIPRLEEVLREKPSYYYPSIVLRDSRKHLGGRDVPCLLYLTFPVREKWLELGVHFDSNAIQYMQSNMYGLSELQRTVAGEMGLKVGSYHPFCDSLVVSEENLEPLREAIGEL